MAYFLACSSPFHPGALGSIDSSRSDCSTGRRASLRHPIICCPPRPAKVGLAQQLRQSTDAGAVDAALPRVALEQVASLAAPVALVAVPGDDAVWIAERAGRVLRIDFDSRLPDDTPYEIVLDITSEVEVGARGGLLGMAASAQWLYIHFTGPPTGDVPPDTALISRVVAFRRAGTSLTGQRVELLAQAQPHANNNGGDIAIGPDGELYVSLGDGGSFGDPAANAQDPRTWLGGLLRLKPTPGASRPYSIPSDNPFASDCKHGAAETYLYGTRNPWRISFDSRNGDLWIADAGGFEREEINVLRSSDGRGNGANLGWPLREGTIDYETGTIPADLVDPAWEYSNPSEGCAVIGGHVYRGSQNARLQGL